VKKALVPNLEMKSSWWYKTTKSPFHLQGGIIVTVEERLETLERKVNLYRWLFLGACVLSVVLAGTSAIAVQSKEIRANRFVLEDDSGRTRGVWETNEKMVSLLFNEPEGHPRILLLDTSEYCGLSIYGQGKKALVNLGAVPGESGLTFRDSWDIFRAGISVRDGDKSSFTLADEKGKDRIQADTFSTDAAFLVNDSNQRPRVGFFVTPKGAVCGITDRSGKMVWNTPLAE
jgi:hypothetical protein